MSLLKSIKSVNALHSVLSVCGALNCLSFPTAFWSMDLFGWWGLLFLIPAALVQALIVRCCCWCEDQMTKLNAPDDEAKRTAPLPPLPDTRAYLDAIT